MNQENPKAAVQFGSRHASYCDRQASLQTRCGRLIQSYPTDNSEIINFFMPVLLHNVLIIIEFQGSF